MPLNKSFTVCIQKFIFTGLIFCIGGVGSLTLFNAFLPGHEYGHHPYHLSFLEEPVHLHNPMPPLQEQRIPAQPVNFLAASRLDTQSNFIFTNPFSIHGAACFCHASPGHSFISVAQANLLRDTSLFNRVFATVSAGRSAWLSLPDKPPQLYFS